MRKLSISIRTLPKSLIFLISTLLRTKNYKKACTYFLVPSLDIDKRFILDHVTNNLFEYKPIITEIDGIDITIRQKMCDLDDVYLSGSTSIIDDLMLRSISKHFLLLLFEYYFRVYFKYKPTLNLLKCDFLRKQFEFVDHDILHNGKTPVLSKYNLITN